MSAPNICSSNWNAKAKGDGEDMEDMERSNSGRLELLPDDTGSQYSSLLHI